MALLNMMVCVAEVPYPVESWAETDERGWESQRSRYYSLCCGSRAVHHLGVSFFIPRLFQSMSTC